MVKFIDIINREGKENWCATIEEIANKSSCYSCVSKKEVEEIL